MEPLEEKDSSPLKDSEITRLIKVSKELGYKKQDKIPERDLIHFKPTSISQIATVSDKKKGHPKKVDATNTEDLLNDQTIDENTKNSSDNSLTDVASNDAIVPEEISTDPTDNTAVETGTNEFEPGEELEKAKLAEVEQSSSSQPQNDAPKKSDSDPPFTEVQASSEENATISPVEQARQEGIEKGKELALRDLETKQQSLQETFRGLIDNIKKKETVDKTDLTQSVLKVITALASERAGVTIQENSEPFKNKIISFVDKIEQSSKRLILNLNPKDAELIEDSIVGAFTDKSIEIVGNSELFRGDFILKMGTVEIGDLISDQITIDQRKNEEPLGSDKSQTVNEVVDPELKNKSDQSSHRDDEELEEKKAGNDAK